MVTAMMSVGARLANPVGVGLANAYLSQFLLDKTEDGVVSGFLGGLRPAGGLGLVGGLRLAGGLGGRRLRGLRSGDSRHL